MALKLISRAALLSVAAALQVHEPSFAAGTYDDTRCDFAPEHYDVTAPGVVATSCPCEWTKTNSIFADGGALLGSILVVPEDICDNACPAASAACAAKLANASGVLLTRAFDPSSELYQGNSLETINANNALFAAFDGTYNASCADASVPTAYVSSNTSALLIDAALDNDTSLIAAHVNDTFVAIALLNVTMAAGDPNDDALDCDKYEYMPLVYLFLVPVWWLLTVLWTWNTYRAHAASARDLHRLLCWVPIMQFVHGILSLFNYSSCPWENTLALVYAAPHARTPHARTPCTLLSHARARTHARAHTHTPLTSPPSLPRSLVALIVQLRDVLGGGDHPQGAGGAAVPAARLQGLVHHAQHAAAARGLLRRLQPRAALRRRLRAALCADATLDGPDDHDVRRMPRHATPRHATPRHMSPASQAILAITMPSRGSGRVKSILRGEYYTPCLGVHLKAAARDG